MAGISTAGEIRTAAEGLQDIGSKISRCLENASHCASSRYIFFLSVAQKTTWPNPQIWNSFYFPCHPLICFSSTRPHCLRVTGQCLLFNEGEKKKMLLYFFSVHGYFIKGKSPHTYTMSWVLPLPRSFCPKLYLWSTAGCHGFRWPVLTAVVCGCRVLPDTYREPGCRWYCCRGGYGAVKASILFNQKSKWEYQHLATTSSRWRLERKQWAEQHQCSSLVRRGWWSGLFFLLIS